MDSEVTQVFTERELRYQKLVKQVAGWWREQLEHASGPGKFDNGDSGGIGSLLASMVAYWPQW